MGEVVNVVGRAGERDGEGAYLGRVRSADGTRIVFERHGAGPPLVYVGGALNDRSAGVPLAGLLASRFTVYTYDRRGRGASGDTLPYAVEREVEDLAALIGEAGGAAAVFGMSSGAALALEGAARGLPITRLALFEPPFAVTAEDHELAVAYAKRLVGLLSENRRDEAVEFFLTHVGLATAIVRRMRATRVWPALTALAHTLAYDSTVLGNVSGTGVLPTGRVTRVTMPTLVIDGEDSTPWIRHGAHAVAAALPDARRRTLPRQTHAVSPNVLAPVLAEFLPL